MSLGQNVQGWSLDFSLEKDQLQSYWHIPGFAGSHFCFISFNKCVQNECVPKWAAAVKSFPDSKKQKSNLRVQ